MKWKLATCCDSTDCSNYVIRAAVLLRIMPCHFELPSAVHHSLAPCCAAPLWYCLVIFRGPQSALLTTASRTQQIAGTGPLVFQGTRPATAHMRPISPPRSIFF